MPEGGAIVEEGCSEEEDDWSIDGPPMNFDFLQTQPNEDLYANEANAAFDKWLKVDINPNKYLYDGVQQTSFRGRLTTRQPSVGEVLRKFDCLKYYRMDGDKKFPTIRILARIHLTEMDNSAFQEQVFSKAACVMGTKQTLIDMEHFEMKTTIFVNADLIHQNII